jgi:hypothetical protein
MLKNNVVTIHTMGLELALPKNQWGGALASPRTTTLPAEEEGVDTFTTTQPAVPKKTTTEKTTAPQWQGLLLQGLVLVGVAVGSFLLGKHWEALIGKQVPKIAETTEKVLPTVSEPPKPPHPNIEKIEKLKDDLRPLLAQVKEYYHEKHLTELSVHPEQEDTVWKRNINWLESKSTKLEDLVADDFLDHGGIIYSPQIRVILNQIQQLLKEMKADEA